MELTEHEPRDAFPAAEGSPDGSAGAGSVALWVHLATLALAFVVLCWVDRRQWFILDEWDLLVDRGFLGRSHEGPLAPHNEHWSTVPIVVYRALFSVFGVRTYAPYLLVLFAVHLGTAHLLWRVIGRAGVGPWIATPAVAVFAVLGVGWENLTQAFQFSLIASIGFGLAAVLVAPEQGPFGRRDVVAWVLLVLGLASSGVGIPLVVVATLVAWARRGWRVAAETAAVPGAVYLAWYVAYGADARGHGEPLSVALRRMPSFLWHGFTDTFGGIVDVERLGPLLIVVFVVALVAFVRPRDPAWIVPLAMTAGAIVFLALVSLRRSGLGLETAGDSRYAYVLVALMLPMTAKLLQVAFGGSRAGRAAVVAAGVLLFVVQVRVLDDHASEWARIEQENRRRVAAAAELLASGARPVEGGAPVPEWAPNLGLRDLRRLARHGDLPGGVDISEADRLTARAYLQVRLDPDPYINLRTTPELQSSQDVRVADAGDGCVRILPDGPDPSVVLRFAERSRIELDAEVDTDVTVAVLGFGPEVGRPRTFGMPGDERQYLSVADALTFRLGLAGHELTLCGLDTPGN